MNPPHQNFESWLESVTLAICIPCLNEDNTIPSVIKSFRQELPNSNIIVYDNSSTDLTAQKAAEAGATVIQVRSRGKGHVVREIFESNEAEYVVLVDGDDTYSPEAIKTLLHLQFESQKAMIVGSRQYGDPKEILRPKHLWGNRILSKMVSWSFKTPVSDILSGYRILPKSLYKNLVLNSKTFDIETELTLQTLALGVKIIEKEANYRARPEDSFSKLNTWSDGILILKTIWLLVRYYRPLFFFGILGMCSALLGLIAGCFPIQDYIREQFVYHVPLALLAASLIIVSLILFSIGIILDSMKYYHNNQMRRLNRLLR